MGGGKCTGGLNLRPRDPRSADPVQQLPVQNSNTVQILGEFIQFTMDENAMIDMPLPLENILLAGLCTCNDQWPAKLKCGVLPTAELFGGTCTAYRRQ